MRWFFSVLWAAMKIFSRSDSFTSAAAISFYALFSIIPLMFLVTAALGFIFGTHAGLLDKVVAMVRESLPYLSERIINDVRGLSSAWKAMGWIGAVTLVWSAEFVLEALAEALTRVFETEQKYGFFRRKVINLFVMFLGVAAALLDILTTALSIVLKKFKLKVFDIDLSYYLIQSLTFQFILPFLLVSAIVAVIYGILSGPNLNMRYAFYGSLIFSALWEVAKHVFAWYVQNFPSYNKFYGSIGALMLLLIWIFYSACIFLFSASLARAAYQKAGPAGVFRFKKR